MQTTVGQLLLNENLPEDMRDYGRVIDKKSLKVLFQELADRYPDKYSEINHKLHTLSQDAATTYGDVTSLSLESLRTPNRVAAMRRNLFRSINSVVKSKGTEEEKNKKIIKLIADRLDETTDATFDEAKKNKNPLALQVISGARGNPGQLRALNAGDMLVVDHKDRPIPIPLLNSYSEGLDPVEYWAGAYGARKGYVSVKFATPKSGFLAKQLALAAHRLVVTEKDCGTTNGIPVLASDPDNEGTVLAQKVGGLAAGSVLNPKDMRKLGDKNIIVRSPITCQAENGVCQRCSGVRERGGFPPLGDNIGLTASQAIAEPVGQGQLSAKHTGGQADASSQKTGMDLIEQLVSVPKTFQGGAALATLDGRVDGVEEAPQGGQFVTIAGTRTWVPPGQELKIKKGDRVEAGDILSSGLPNPAEIVKYKGIGEGRRYYTQQFLKAMNDSNFSANRRNVELLARGLINHVRISNLDGPADTVPDDVVEFDSMTRGYRPRFGFKTVAPKRAVGLYLESPALHYSIGTKITPRVAKQLGEYGIKSVKAHADAPSFVPEMTRAMETLLHSSDWMVRMGGFHLKSGLTKAVHRTQSSDEHGASYIPSLAKGVDFGRVPKGKGY